MTLTRVCCSPKIPRASACGSGISARRIQPVGRQTPSNDLELTHEEYFGVDVASQGRGSQITEHAVNKSAARKRDKSRH